MGIDSVHHVPLILIGVFLARIVGYRIYRLFIYPYFVSPLRHLPGPKVRKNLTFPSSLWKLTHQ